jgi:transcription-repair coupling factor (superfamily II helicase)
MRSKLEKLLPEARIVVGHGQMKERELERVMRDFTQQRVNVLLCTTIIETGIDNPHANTIVINRADKFGLAQLHQLRGRVGRSHHQAYAYLLTHDDAALNKQARQRLEAIQMMDELGAGFYLAMHDLEIRGAGEVLGDNQSGKCRKSASTCSPRCSTAPSRRSNRARSRTCLQPLAIATEINLHTPALLPNDYAPDVQQRLALYKRLANCTTGDDIADLQEELVDRFGELPPQARALLDSHRLRLLCKPLGVSKLDATAEQIVVQFEAEPPIDPMCIINLIQRDRNYRLSGPDKLLLKRHCPTLADRVAAVKDMIHQLSRLPKP